MPFTAKQLKKIRSILPKNFRQLISAKCAENGIKLTVRQITLVLNNESVNKDFILAVTEAIAELLREQKQLQKDICEKINAELN